MPSRVSRRLLPPRAKRPAAAAASSSSRALRIQPSTSVGRNGPERPGRRRGDDGELAGLWAEPLAATWSWCGGSASRPCNSLSACKARELRRSQLAPRDRRGAVQVGCVRARCKTRSRVPSHRLSVTRLYQRGERRLRPVLSSIPLPAAQRRLSAAASLSCLGGQVGRSGDESFGTGDKGRPQLVNAAWQGPRQVEVDKARLRQDSVKPEVSLCDTSNASGAGYRRSTAARGSLQRSMRCWRPWRTSACAMAAADCCRRSSPAQTLVAGWPPRESTALRPRAASASSTKTPARQPAPGSLMAASRRLFRQTAGDLTPRSFRITAMQRRSVRGPTHAGELSAGRHPGMLVEPPRPLEPSPRREAPAGPRVPHPPTPPSSAHRQPCSTPSGPQRRARALPQAECPAGLGVAGIHGCMNVKDTCYHRMPLPFL